MRNQATAATHNPRKILLIVDDCHTGDALRILPYLDAVRRRYPQARITVSAHEEAVPAIAQAGIFDRIVTSHVYPKRYAGRRPSRIEQRLALLPRMALLIARLGVGYDLVLTFWWGTTALHLLGYAAGWRGERVGYTRGMPGLLTSRIGAFDSHQDHKLQHDRLLRAADIEPPAPDASRVRFTPADADHVASLLQDHQLVGKPLIVLHPGADWACQQWQQERWMVLADELASRYQAAIVFTGVESEASYIRTIQGGMSAPSVSLAGRTTLMQLAALLTRATAAVCVDSAIYELTQAANLPAVVLTGPTRPEQVMPGTHKPIILRRMDADRYATIRACRQTRYMNGGCHEYTCSFAGLREISVAAALEAVERQMQGARQGVQGRQASVSSVPHAIA